MRVLVCTVEVTPCPPENVTTVALVDTVAPELFGITPESILKAYSFGFGAVLMFWLIGYALGLGLGMIKKT